MCEQPDSKYLSLSGLHSLSTQLCCSGAEAATDSVYMNEPDCVPVKPIYTEVDDRLDLSFLSSWQFPALT